VDEVLAEEEVMLRPLPVVAGAPAIFDSMALLASGRPVPVISQRWLAETQITRGAEIRPTVGQRIIRLLLVDDCLVTREMVRRLLEDAGFAVSAVPSAAEALRHLAESDYDCLITDIEMPEMDGLELTRHLRETSRYAHLPVVVVSTRDRPGDRLAGLDAGADAYLTKQGLDAGEFVSLIRRLGEHA
jgi:CheY-like chemotaxis protein